MAAVFTWWFVLQMASVAGIPLGTLLLRRLPDRGYAFLKPLGLLTWGYLVWLAASLHVLPNSRLSIMVMWFVLAGIAAWLVRRNAPEVLSFVKERWRYIVAVEVLFALGLAGAAFMRAYVPDIYGTEKPMDIAMLTGVLRSDFFPPQDPWLSGHTVSYYYGGYVLNGIVASLTGLAPAVAFNVALAGTAAVAAVAMFGLGWNVAMMLAGRGRLRVVGAYLCGGLAVVLFLVLGSAEGVLEMIAAAGHGPDAFWEWWNIEGLRPSSSEEWYPDEFWFWWRATRTTPDTIVEFPFFSFLLGDLHPHLMALPLGVTGLAIALARLAAPIATTGRRALLEFGALAVFLGGLAWVNTWDLPTFGFLIVAATAIRLGMDGEFRGGRFALHTLALLVVAVLLYLPFYLTFRSQASGLLPDRSDGTRPAIAALLWLPLLLGTAMLLFRRGGGARKLGYEWVLAPLGLVAVWSMGLFIWEGPAELRELMGNRGSGWFTILGYALLAGALFAATARWRRRAPPAWTFAALTGGCGVLLLLGAELFYIRDVFDNRMNTVFKLSYQAWPLLAIAATTGVLACAEGIASGTAVRRVAGGFALAVTSVAIAAGLTYSVTAALNRTDGFGRQQTLDGLAYLRRSDPGEYALVQWLGTLGPDTRIVEANGRDYTPSGRVAARTGLQGVIGWVGHELQWRGSKAPYEGRYEDVEELYSTTDVNRADEILRTYGVDYVIVGREERNRYPASGLRKFARRFDVAFQAGDVTVYAVPQD